MKTRNATFVLGSAMWLISCNPGHPLVTPSQIIPPTLAPNSSQFAAATTPSLDSSGGGYIAQTLNCTTYIETTWGGGPGEWGNPKQLGRLHYRFPPPAFDSKGEMYIADFVNHRLLKYDDSGFSPPQVVSLPEHYFSVPLNEENLMPWSGISVAGDSIIIPYDVDKVGVLSLSGEEVEDLRIPNYHYNFMLPGWYLAWMDARGGLAVKGAYFDEGWKSNVWEKVATGNFLLLSPFSWEDYIGDIAFLGGEVGLETATPAFPTIQLYETDASQDFLDYPSMQIDPGLKDMALLLLGVDQNGWAYMATNLQSQPAIARYSLANRTGHVKLPFFIPTESRQTQAFWIANWRGDKPCNASWGRMVL